MDLASDYSIACSSKNVMSEPDSAPVSAGTLLAKRCFDVVVSGSALLFFAPAIGVIWVGVRASSRGPGLFWSRRVGRGGRTFLMPKFRSMESGTDVVSREVLQDSQLCITSFGHFLRSTSLDELPQLWSVFRGQMSLVGPRALIPNDIAIPERARFAVIGSIRPGITGLAQIRGRNAVSPRRKARYDVFYTVRVSLGLDLYILWRTVFRVLLRRDII